MKSLYESIIGSNNADARSLLKDIILNPKGKEAELNRLWKKFDLSFDAGYGEGYWHQLPNEPVTYFVPIKTTSELGKGVYRLALIGREDLASDIVVILNTTPHMHRLEMRKWTEKVSRILHMDLHRDKYTIKLNFT